MLKLMGKKIFTILHLKNVLILTYAEHDFKIQLLIKFMCGMQLLAYLYKQSDQRNSAGPYQEWLPAQKSADLDNVV